MEQEDLVKRILKTLKGSRVNFIVVGGYAWERNVMPAGTLDLDIMILASDYERMLGSIPAILRKENIFADLLDRHPVMSLFRVSRAGVSLELETINSEYYSRGAKDFLTYAKQYRCTPIGGVYYAKPELIWYMRLRIPDWETYITKCLRELVLSSRRKKFRIRFSDIMEISRVFGTEEAIKPRLLTLKKYIQRQF